jgi:uncharacterized protein YjbI with pentapeptide repeats
MVLGVKMMKWILLPLSIALAFTSFGGSAQALKREHLWQLDRTNICRSCDLTDAPLRGGNLRGADLTGSNLTRADLRDANLVRTTLTGATLAGTDLRGADLTGATIDTIQVVIRSARLDETTILPNGLTRSGIRPPPRKPRNVSLSPNQKPQRQRG